MGVTCISLNLDISLHHHQINKDMKAKEISLIESTYRQLCDILVDMNSVSRQLLPYCNDEEYKKFISARSFITDLTLDVSNRLSSELKNILG